MPGPLQLDVTAYRNPREWQWTLLDSNHAYLADHNVSLDPQDSLARAFADPVMYLRYLVRVEGSSAQPDELGRWMGDQLFGPLRGPLAAYVEAGGRDVDLRVPPGAETLALWPFERARFGAETPHVQGLTFGEAGLRFICRLSGTRPTSADEPAGESLRVLAGFRRAAEITPNDLRLERFELEEVVRRLVASGQPVALRLVHPAAAPGVLQRELQAAERWNSVLLLGPCSQGPREAAEGPLVDDWDAPYEQGAPQGAADEKNVEQIVARARRHTTYLPRIEAVLNSLEQAFDRAEHVKVPSLLGNLSTQLLDRDPLTALVVAHQMAWYAQRTGLGPWRQLADAQHRLDAMNALGRYEEVLQEVGAFCERMEALPPDGAVKEEVDPLLVREAILEAGHQAAVLGEAWQTALDLNAKIIRCREVRGDSPAQLARKHFDDYRPLLRLGRYGEARYLLERCRETFAAAGEATLSGMVHSALADVEDAAGNSAAAVRQETVAMQAAYASGVPGECAIAHAAFALYLKRASAEPGAVLAHDLAAALIWHQTGSAAIEGSLRRLAESQLPSPWPSFAELATTLTKSPGVPFGALFAQLPRCSPDGDAALLAVRERMVETRLGDRRARARRNWLKRESS